MKRKILTAAFILVITALLVSGCANRTSGTDVSGSSSPDMMSAPETSATVKPADVKNDADLYRYVKNNIFDIPQAAFSKWEKRFFDITGDGSDEVVLVPYFGEGWHDKIEIISGDSGELERIPSDIMNGADGSRVEFADGLMAVSASDGGSGLQYTTRSIYVYDGAGLVPALDGLEIYYALSTPSENYYNDSYITGDYKDFTYTLVKYDYAHSTQTIEKRVQYTYNPETMRYTEKALEPVIAPPTGVDFMDITPRVSDGSLTIQYDGSDKKITIMGAYLTYEGYKNGESMVLRDVYVDEVSMEEGDLHVWLRAADYDGTVYCIIDWTNFHIQVFDVLEPEGADDPAVRLTGLTNETIRGESIKYSDYSAVIIPWYPSNGKNSGVLGNDVVQDDVEGDSLYFSVFGKMEDVIVYRHDDVNTVSGEWTLGDIENTNIEIMSGLPGDISYYSIEGNVYIGEGDYVWLSFNMDDMREPEGYDITFIS